MAVKIHRKGKAGDSGGCWQFSGKSASKDVQFAVLHSSERGVQITPKVKKWIDKVLDKSGEKATWSAKASIKKK